MEQLFKNTQAYRLLKRECEGENLSHAYLLVCNDPKNLRFLLKTFAKVLFACDEVDFFKREEREDKERLAKLIDSESFSDCIFLPEEGKKLVVEDAEKILEESLLIPIEGDKKAFVLGDFADANVQTQNKLLKLLEEPPKNVVFLLGATSVFSVLPTVLSRAKKLEIHPFDVEEVKNCLSRIYGTQYDAQTLELCAAASGGYVGEAQNLLEGGYYQSLLDGAFALCLEESSRLPVLFKTLGETKYKKELLSLLRLIFRDALVVKTGVSKGKGVLLQSEKERLKKTAQTYSVSALLYAQEVLGEAELQVKFNAVFTQCLGVCISKIREKK